MSEPVSTAPAPVAARPTEAPYPRGIAWLRLVLAVVVLGWVAAVVLVGAKPVDYRASLPAAVADGSVDAVEVVGLRMAPDTLGGSVLQVRWRQGLWRYQAEVTEVHLARGETLESHRQSDDGGELALSTDVVSELRALPTPSGRPLRVTTDPDGSIPGGEVGDLVVPGWVTAGGVVTWLVVLGLIVSGPQPWRATRWAWFWLFGLAPPLGVLAFLALSGPTPGLPHRTADDGRLTGGWALLIAFLVGSVTTTALGWPG